MGGPATFTRGRLRRRAPAATSGSATARTSPAPRRTSYTLAGATPRRRRRHLPGGGDQLVRQRHQQQRHPDGHLEQPAHRRRSRRPRTTPSTPPATPSATPAPAPTPRTAPCRPRAFTWQVDFHHDTHAHPFVPAASGVHGAARSSSPPRGETAANVWYRIHLTVRDSGGLTSRRSRDVVPRTSTITLATDPAGLRLTLDGQPVDGAAVGARASSGIQRTLGARRHRRPSARRPTSSTSWSDGGAATHTIATPAADTTYTATFRVSADPARRLGLAGDLLRQPELHRTPP